MKSELRHAVGSLLVVGLESTELTALERAWLKLIRPAGVILFRRNITSAQQTRSLLNEATALCATNSFRCVDVEGGSVDRLRDALAPMPSARAVADAAAITHNDALMRQHGELIAQAIKAFGFNTTLAPVLDLALPVSAQVMGTRTAASTSEGVIHYASNFLAGLAHHGVVGCAKHFPGLGSGAVDSHALTPSIHRSLRQLNCEDLAPFRALIDQLPMIMINHAAYPETPSKQSPATASSFWVTKVLRGQLHYRGLAFSDDLEMGGILQCMSIEEAAVRSLRVGMDLLEICKSPALILRAYEALITESERSKSFRALLLQRAQRTVRLRQKLFAAPLPKPLTEKQFASLKSRIEKYSATIRNLQPAVDRTTP